MSRAARASAVSRTRWARPGLAAGGSGEAGAGAGPLLASPEAKGAAPASQGRAATVPAPTSLSSSLLRCTSSTHQWSGGATRLGQRRAKFTRSRSLFLRTFSSASCRDQTPPGGKGGGEHRAPRHTSRRLSASSTVSDQPDAWVVGYLGRAHAEGGWGGGSCRRPEAQLEPVVGAGEAIDRPPERRADLRARGGRGREAQEAPEHLRRLLNPHAGVAAAEAQRSGWR